MIKQDDVIKAKNLIKDSGIDPYSCSCCGDFYSRLWGNITKAFEEVRKESRTLPSAESIDKRGEKVKKWSKLLKHRAKVLKEQPEYPTQPELEVIDQSLVLLAEIRSLENDVIQQGAVLQWIEEALNGEEISDLAESFPIVRRVRDLVQRSRQE